jgi:hypothetical protein
MMHLVESMGKGFFGGLTLGGRAARFGFKAARDPGEAIAESAKRGWQNGTLNPTRWFDKLNTKAGGWWDEHVSHYWRGDHLSKRIRNTTVGRVARVFDGTVGAALRLGGSAAGAGVGLVSRAFFAPIGLGIGLVARPTVWAAKMGVKGAAKGAYNFVTDKNMWRGMRDDIRALTGLGLNKKGTGLFQYAWGLRRSALFGLGLTGALVVGEGSWSGMRAFSDARIGEALPVDEYGETFITPQPLPQAIKHKAPDALINDYSATGDLVFALNNLRNGGIL